MPRVGAGAGDGLSTGAASALLGAQDAEYLREGTAPRRKAGQDPGAEDLLGRACCCRAAGLCALPLSLAVPLPGDGPPTGARSAGVVALLRLSTTPVAEAAHHQRDRTLFRRSPAPDPTHGGVHQRGKRGSDYLCDFQSLQRGLEKPHPPTIYTSSLTSPRAEARLPLFRRVASMSAPCRISNSQKNSCAFSSLACQTCSRLCVALWLPNHPVLKKQPQIVAAASSPKNGGSEARASNESLRSIVAIISASLIRRTNHVLRVNFSF